VVPLALAHLLPILAEHPAEDDAGLKRVGVGNGWEGGIGSKVQGPRSKVFFGRVRLWTLDRPASRVPRLWTGGVAEQHRADRELAIEPAPRLIERFADEVGGELFAELVLARVRIAPLGEGHDPAVVPAVDDFADATHA